MNHVFLMILWENKNNRKEKMKKKRKNCWILWSAKRIHLDRNGILLAFASFTGTFVQLANLHQLGKKRVVVILLEKHRIVEVGRNFWRSYGSTPCSSRAT